MSEPAVSAQAGPRDAVVRDDAAAFEDFFRGQTQSLYTHPCLITDNRAEAEELAQDAFLKVWSGGLGWRGRARRLASTRAGSDGADRGLVREFHTG